MIQRLNKKTREKEPTTKVPRNVANYRPVIGVGSKIYGAEAKFKITQYFCLSLEVIQRFSMAT